MKINYDFGAKLLNFLKKMGSLPKTYKTIIKTEKILSIAQLREKGLFINQEAQIIEA